MIEKKYIHWTYVICRIKGLSVRGDIACKPKKANYTGKYKVKVTFDSNTEVDSNEQFEYLQDPVIKATEPAELKSISRYLCFFSLFGQPLNVKQNS